MEAGGRGWQGRPYGPDINSDTMPSVHSHAGGCSPTRATASAPLRLAPSASAVVRGGSGEGHDSLSQGMPPQGPCALCGRISLTKHKPIGLDEAFGGMGVRAMRRTLRRAAVVLHFEKPKAGVICFTGRPCYTNLRDALLAADAYTRRERQTAVSEVHVLTTTIGGPDRADGARQAVKETAAQMEEGAVALQGPPKRVCGTPHCGLPDGHQGLCSTEVVAAGAKRARQAPTMPKPAADRKGQAATLPLWGGDLPSDRQEGGVVDEAWSTQQQAATAQIPNA